MIGIAAVIPAFLVLGWVALGGSEKEAGGSSNQDFGFEHFCHQWTDKLQERERFNRRSVKWEPVGSQIAGEYVGYGKVTGCRVKLSSDRHPVGMLTYEEVTYRLEGSSPQEAERGAARIVARTPVTEIFQFRRGRWQY